MASGTIALAAALALALTAFGTAIGQGWTASKAMDAIARQPEAAGNIRGALVISLALMEALTIYGMLVAFVRPGENRRAKRNTYSEEAVEC